MIYKEGDTSKAICHVCETLVQTYAATRWIDVVHEKDCQCLVFVCSECHNVVATPQQSTPAIKAVLDASKMK